MFDGILPLLWTFLCVVVIVGLAYWFTKYIVGRGFGPYGAGEKTGSIRVLSRLTVGKDQQLLLVRAGTRYFLVGAAQGGISTLAEFSQEEAEAWMEAGEQGASPPSFSQALGTVLRQRKKR